jgi:hypothetical protein
MKYIYIAVALLVTLVCNAQENDVFPEMRLFSNIYSKYALDEKPMVPADTNLIAIWKMQEDVDNHNYFVVERSIVNAFVFTYMNREGSNRTYENVTAFFSKIGNTDFINVGFRELHSNSSGYFFLKVTDMDSRGWHMTLSLVGDTTLRDVASREELRARIAKNMDNPAYFQKPVHFIKKLPLMYCK